jgi:hypothetical protein
MRSHVSSKHALGNVLQGCNDNSSDKSSSGDLTMSADYYRLYQPYHPAHSTTGECVTICSFTMLRFPSRIIVGSPNAWFIAATL